MSDDLAAITLASVEKARGFVRTHPETMVILEDIRPDETIDVIAHRLSTSGDVEWFNKLHADAWGRWSRPAETVKTNLIEQAERFIGRRLPPSYLSFLYQFGSLTWLVNQEILDVPMRTHFEPDNFGFLAEGVAGGGWCVLHLPSIKTALQVSRDVHERYLESKPNAAPRSFTFHGGGGEYDGVSFDLENVQSAGEPRIFNSPCTSFAQWLEETVEQIVTHLAGQLK